MAKTSFFSGTGTNVTEVDAIDSIKTEAQTAATNAAASASNAAASASSAAASASEALSHKNAITSLTVATGAAGSSVSYDSSTGLLTVPRGDTGATGSAGADGDNTITVKNEGVALTTDATTLDFVGSGVTASGTGAEKTITITDTVYSLPTASESVLGGIKVGTGLTITSGVLSADSSGIIVEDEGVALTTAASTLNFTGNGVVASGTGSEKTITINALDNVAEDTTPQLGGNLDVNGNSIVSAGAGNIAITPDTTGSIVLDGLSWPQADGNDGDALKTDGAGNLSFGAPYQLMVENASGSPTLPVINATNTGFSIAIGHQANVGANCTAGLAIQGSLTKDGVTDNASSIAIGGGSAVNGGLTNTAIGPLAQSGGTSTSNDVALGSSFANGGSSTAINISNNTSTYGATASSSIAIGNQAKASHTNSVAIGKDSVSSANNRISLGSSSQTVEISGAYRLPSSDGTANQVLQTDGSGTLTFATVSGGGGLSDVVDDTTPQLGGNLDVNGNSIVSVSAGNITITPDTTGSIVLDGQNWPQADGSANQFLKTNGSGQLSYATVTQATGNELENVVEDTTPQLGGNLDLNSNNITGTGDITPTGDIKPTTYQETVGTESSGTLDLSTGNVFSHTPSTNVTYVFSNPPSTGTAFGFTLKVTPSSTITQTWPASVDWAGGTAPDATASGETDVFTFYTQDGGTTYYGFQPGNAMA